MAFQNLFRLFGVIAMLQPGSAVAMSITSASDAGQQIALASYINPSADPGSWKRLIDYPASKVSILVANVQSGPGSVADASWASNISAAHASGKTVLGYVRTGYLGKSSQQYQTRQGSIDTADWAVQIQIDIDAWHSMYPGVIGGVFLDEGFPECGTNNENAELYRLISETTKRKYPGALTVINPGSPMPQCFEHSADTLMTFENSYENYMDSAYIPNNWVAKDPRKIWHIVYRVPADKAGEVTAKALQRGAGYVHITAADQPNPYNTLPSEAYMDTVINAVPGGKPLVESPLAYPNDGTPGAQPTGLTVVASEYTSVTLSWSSGSGTPLVYAIFHGNTEIARVMGTMTKITIGGFAPGTTGLVFTVAAIGGDGVLSSASKSVTSSTTSLPGGKTIIDLGVTYNASSTTYSANVLVPYSSLRIFITDPDTACVLPAWPINYNAQANVCAHYMVEADTLYKYNANTPDNNMNWPWAWANTGASANVKLARNKHAYTWTLPIGSDTVDPRNYVVQGQDYSSFSTNVFDPCPARWNSATPYGDAQCEGTA